MIFDPALGMGLTELIGLISDGNFEAAQKRADGLLLRYPEQAELWRLSGICALQQGELDAAERAMQRALKLAPQSVEALCNLASVYTAGGRMAEAERTLRRALAAAPQHAGALNNLGSLLDARGDYHGAADCFARAIKQRPDYERAWLNQAAALLAVRQLDRAQTSARRAVALAPQWSDAHFMLGNILAACGQDTDALAAWREAVRLAPGRAPFQYQLGLALDAAGDFSGAWGAYQTCLEIAPDFWPALSQLTYMHRRRCDWRALPALSRRLIEGIEHDADGITPFSMLAEDTTPAQQLRCAKRFAAGREAKIKPVRERLMPRPHARREGPLRVGFIAAGFGEHPTTSLTIELIERLRDSSLRTLGYATNRDDRGALRKRLAKAFHLFRDLSGFSLEAMLHKIRDDQPDILIDLDGYCSGSCAELFALRPAPLQVNWLAYPGTLGAPWYDYLIADEFVIPAEQRAHYSENIVTLSRCYQPSDTQRRIAQSATRADLGLPEKAVVFACFNHSWKYTLRSFARWMRILKSVPDSVLWLLAGPPGSGADEHMCAAAEAAGVDPLRLIFALRAPHAEHLARYRHIDLFLDTNPYNAHTTASDALWVGCPVLTLPGTTFASRVAGSLNHYLGLDECNATSDQAYIETAVRLGLHPDDLRALRERLANARERSGLFDMAAFTHDFEAALIMMFRRFERGNPPQDFKVPT
ncbi:MAG TPA: tetratricopeptide repeat protein [Rudaea sp.]|nr:tetratricopeptide repeat protein [Rudaea sp.]